MNRTSLRSVLAVALFLVSLPGQAQDESLDNIHVIEKTGDLLQVGIPLLALGLSFVLDPVGASDSGLAEFKPGGMSLDGDWLSLNGRPRHDLALAIARTEIATYVLKYSVNAERPNGGGQSFPSGHTSVAFAGAEFIRKEYGEWWGIPAYLTAGYVGWTRVVTRNHHARDVYAGAAIGILSNHDLLNFTIPFGQLRVSPSLLLSGSGGYAPARSIEGESLDITPAVLVPGLELRFQF